MTMYQGGCQCGAVRWSVEASLDQPVICNCSRCQRLGSVLVFAPKSAFVLERGEGAQSEYRFNKRVIRHLFCATCGIESYSEAKSPEGVDMVAVNVNCLDGVNPREVATHAFGL
ncbi:Glutathione-dependent formaldehyde-activating enzyme [compost metagenome]